MLRFNGKVVIVTGAARGQGLAAVRLFAAEGASIVATDILPSVREVFETTTERDRHLLLDHDVTDERQWRDVVEAALAKYGRIDVLVNNAGVTSRTGIEETSIAEWDRVLRINAQSVLLGMQSVLPSMRQSQNGGAIVNVSSIYALVGSGASAAYQASKAAVHMLTKTAAVQYAKDNVRVNSVHPGIIDTPMIADMTKDRYNILVSGTPMGRLGSADEVAKGVVFLASDDASFITGTELVIDGGYTAR